MNILVVEGINASPTRQNGAKRMILRQYQAPSSGATKCVRSVFYDTEPDIARNLDMVCVPVVYAHQIVRCGHYHHGSIRSSLYASRLGADWRPHQQRHSARIHPATIASSRRPCGNRRIRSGSGSRPRRNLGPGENDTLRSRPKWAS